MPQTIERISRISSLFSEIPEVFIDLTMLPKAYHILLESRSEKFSHVELPQKYK